MLNNLFAQLDPIINPLSMAVLGASNDPLKWGNWSIFGSLDASYKGDIFPVNPKEETILGIKAFPRILDIPADVDLAVIALPAPVVKEAMLDCVQKKVKGVVILSGGFSEIGETGNSLQNEILKIARDHQVRIVGPNTPGMFNSAIGLSVGVRLKVGPGSIAFISQSGTLSEVMIRKIQAKRCGLSKFIGVGNQADLNSADFIEYLGQDPATGVIVVYSEGFTDARRFVDVASKVTREKPIIIFKAGRTSVGKRSALSHTASLTGDDALFDSICRQVGLLRAYETDHLFVMAEALAKQPLPAGKRVGIISGGGALCVVLAEQCALLGLDIPLFDEKITADLKKDLAPFAPIPKNPVDALIGTSTPDIIPRLAEKIIQLPYIDGIIANPSAILGYSEIKSAATKAGEDSIIQATEELASLPERFGKPLIVFVTNPNDTLLDILMNADIPYYETPEECARAMFALTEYAHFLRSTTPP
ncbi:MAG: CoA-binding protein [Halobacteriota archaeon]|nr:CoA-binding protein [Halobacteriota archaeon]